MKKQAQPPYRLLANNRFWILSFSVLIAALTWFSVWTLVPSGGDLQLIRLQQTYGFIGLAFLYFALLATPLTKVFPNIRGKNTYLHARRALGVSAFFFSLLHAVIAFFGQLGALSGVQFLTDRYQLSLLLGGFTLIVLAAMALTSFDKVIDRMGFPRWKKLHRLIYLGGIAVLIHVIMIGTHYAYGSTLASRVTLAALLILFLLEAVRIDAILKQRFKALRSFGVASIAIMHLIFLGFGFILGKNNNELPGIRSHNSHGQSGEHGAEYVSFEPAATIDGRTIRISQKQLAQSNLVAGETIKFAITPAIDNLRSSSCFLINQETYLYTNGFTKPHPEGVECLPIGDVNPPQPGFYTIYLRLVQDDKINTIPFNLEVTP